MQIVQDTFRPSSACPRTSTVYPCMGYGLAERSCLVNRPQSSRIFTPEKVITSCLIRQHKVDVCLQLANSAPLASELAVEQEYCVVNFYHLVDLENPQDLIDRHKSYLHGKEVKGRIYFSEQGVNAQYGGLKKDAVGYAEWLKANEPFFHDLAYSVYPAETHMFPKLRLQYKPNLISLAGGMSSVPVTKPEARATKVKPHEWRNMLEHGIDGEMPIVLDVRNSYEWDAGHFKGAERPAEENFHETPTDTTEEHIPKPLQQAGPNTPVMMYCTGGIRCDVYSTYLRQKGYDNLYTLEGGIQNYLKSEGLDYWKGSLYVFDGRMAIRPNKDKEEPLEAVANCALCGDKPILPHLNCANVDCNKLFLACQACQDKYRGCCCESCMHAPRLVRPIKPEGAYGQYAKMSKYVED